VQCFRDGSFHHLLCHAFLNRAVDDEVCTLCHQGGKVVQCTYFRCEKTLHVMCAKKSGFVSFDPNYGVQGEAMRMILCPEHASSNNMLPENIKAMMVSVSERDLPKALYKKRALKVPTVCEFSHFKKEALSRVGNMQNMLRSIDKSKEGMGPSHTSVDRPIAKAYEWENTLKTAVYSLEKALARDK
jgi:hypothetical protein